MAIPKLLLAESELASRDETGRGGGVNGMAELFDIGDEVVIYDVGGCGDDFAAGERRHIIAAMGHIVDCGKEIGFVRVDGFASDCEVNHFVGDGVESGANLITCLLYTSAVSVSLFLFLLCLGIAPGKGLGD